MKRKILSALCVVMLVISATEIINDFSQRQGEVALFETITSEVKAVKKDMPEKEVTRSVFDIYNELYEQNNDLVGWISIDGTEVDYPVMQTENNPEFYLRNDFERKYSISGVPFIGVGCKMEPQSTNLIIYGHNMRNGTMFADLISYKSKDYYLENPIINFDTLEESQEYEIMAVFVVDTTMDNGHFEFYNFIEAKTEEQFYKFVNDAKRLSYYDTGVEASFGDKFITLVTCEKTTSTNGRLVVIAVEKDS